MRNKLISVFVLWSVLVCSGCGLNYPYAWAAYRLNGKKPWKSQSLERKVKKDMIECGFPGVHRVGNWNMPGEKEIEAQLCMENKGYRWTNSKIRMCDYDLYKNSETCKKMRGE
ncbi:hypothetical protein [Moraxella marmotae]|uniref:hypothetical protein n=1 Tax=Moraxella marmotae TaxID=3344520 RepID=UPI0035F3CA7F